MAIVRQTVTINIVRRAEQTLDLAALQGQVQVDGILAEISISDPEPLDKPRVRRGRKPGSKNVEKAPEQKKGK